MSAIEADLVSAGYSFDDVPERLPWRALFAFLDNLGPGSAFFRARLDDPVKAAWIEAGPAPLLLSQAGYLLEILAWQQTKDGQKNRNRPKPWPTPWDGPDKGKTVIGRGAIKASEWADFWGDGS